MEDQRFTSSSLDLPYTVMIEPYSYCMEHMWTIYLEREKIKVLGLVGLVGKRVVSPPSWYPLVLWVNGVVFPPCCDPSS